MNRWRWERYMQYMFELLLQSNEVKRSQRHLFMPFEGLVTYIDCLDFPLDMKTKVLNKIIFNSMVIFLSKNLNKRLRLDWSVLEMIRQEIEIPLYWSFIVIFCQSWPCPSSLQKSHAAWHHGHVSWFHLVNPCKIWPIL